MTLQGFLRLIFLGVLTYSINGDVDQGISNNIVKMSSNNNEQAQLDKSAQGDRGFIRGKRAHVRTEKGKRRLQNETDSDNTNSTPSFEDFLGTGIGNSSDSDLLDLLLAFAPNVTDFLGSDGNSTITDLSGLIALLPSLLSSNSTDSSLLGNSTDLSALLSSFNLTELLSNSTSGSDFDIAELLESILGSNSTTGTNGTENDIDDLLAAITNSADNGTVVNISDILGALFNSSELEDLASIYDTTGFNISALPSLDDLLNLTAFLSNFTLDDLVRQYNMSDLLGNGENITQSLQDLVDRIENYTNLTGNATISEVLDALFNDGNMDSLADIVYNILGVNVSSLPFLDNITDLVETHVDYFASKSPEELAAFLSNYTIDDFVQQHNFSEPIVGLLENYTNLTGDAPFSKLLDVLSNSSNLEDLANATGLNISDLLLGMSTGSNPYQLEGNTQEDRTASGEPANISDGTMDQGMNDPTTDSTTSDEASSRSSLESAGRSLFQGTSYLIGLTGVLPMLWLL